jgi:hypothetical protein
MSYEITAAHAIITIRSILFRSPNRRSPLIPSNWARRFSPMLGSFTSFVKQRSPNIFILDESPELDLIFVRISPEFSTEDYLAYQRIVAAHPLPAIPSTPVFHEDPQHIALCKLVSQRLRVDICGGSKVFEKAAELLESLMAQSPSWCLREKCIKTLSEAGIPPIPLEWFESQLVVPGISTVYLRSNPQVSLQSSSSHAVKLVEETLSLSETKSLTIEFLCELLQKDSLEVTHILKSCPLVLYEPELVYSCQEFERSVVGYISSHTREEMRIIQELSSMSPFEHLVRSIEKAIEFSPDKRISTDHVISWCGSLDVKPKLIWQCLRNKVFWSCHHSDLQVLIRSSRGKEKFVIPEGHEPLPQDIVKQIKLEVQNLGTNCTVDKLTAGLHWGKSSDNSRKYGTLRQVLEGVSEVFYDPHFMYDLSSIMDQVVFPETTEEIDSESIFKASDTAYRNMMQLNATIVYYLGQAGYPSYPLSDVQQAAATMGLGPDVLSRSSYLFVPGNNVYLRKSSRETIVLEGSVEEAILFALRSSGRKAVDFDNLFRAINESARFSQADIDQARRELTSCRDLHCPGSGPLRSSCFFNPEVVVLDALASEYLELPVQELKKPILLDASAKQDLHEDTDEI